MAHQIVGREEPRNRLALEMARRLEDHEPVNCAIRDALKHVNQFDNMLILQQRRIDAPNEPAKVGRLRVCLIMRLAQRMQDGILKPV